MMSSLGNLHILKTLISLEQKEIFENSKQHFTSHIDYLFMFSNDFDWNDATFVIVLYHLKERVTPKSMFFVITNKKLILS